MLIGSYRFACRFNKDAVLPEYKGSTFRGGFGLALKQTVCALKRQECPTCLLKTSCLYARVFEERPTEKGYQRLATAPHPYVINPTLSTERHYPKGSSFDFDLLLFGKDNDSLPFFVYALKQMGDKGLGKGRAPFTLEQVTYGEQVVYQQSTQQLTMPEKLTELFLKPPSAEGVASVTLEFLTPLRLKLKGTLARELNFQTLMRAVLRRISGLESHYGRGEPEIDYRELIARAEQVSVIASTLRWHDWERYSNRQQEAMNFGGLVGKVSFSSVPGVFLPLLSYAEQVNLGKQTSFGLGRFVLDVQ